MFKIRILIADDHALVRSGFRALLSAQTDMEVVGEAGDGVEAVEKCRTLAPDVVLMDLTMPGRSGIQAIQDLQQTCPDIKVIVVTMHEDETYARQALLAGATGYVLKKAVGAELIAAIHSVQQGQLHVASSLSASVNRSSEAVPKTPSNGSVIHLITSREREVAGLVALGYTNHEIARRLHISEKTVESHRKQIMSKLNFHSRADLVRFAIEYRLIEI